MDNASNNASLSSTISMLPSFVFIFKAMISIQKYKTVGKYNNDCWKIQQSVTNTQSHLTVLQSIMSVA